MKLLYKELLVRLARDEMILEPPTAERSSSAKLKSDHRARILIADDHQPVLGRTACLLQAHFEVIGSVTDGKMLVQEALRLQPDVIVSDILMPGLNGLEAAHQLRERGCNAKFIFLSVYESADFVRASFSVGGSAYVTKARMGMDLVTAIKEVLQGRKFTSPSVEPL
jgi:DNA-binding NarL/FixJ family response regulator